MAGDGSVQLCAGCSSGSIQVFSISPGLSIRPSTSLAHSDRPILSLASAFQARRGGWADDIGSELVSCDDAGTIRVWLAQAAGSYVPDTGVVIKAGVPCCSLAVRKGFIIAAGIDGCVRIYNMVRRVGGGRESRGGRICNCWGLDFSRCHSSKESCVSLSTLFCHCRRLGGCGTRLWCTVAGCQPWTSTRAKISLPQQLKTARWPSPSCQLQEQR